MQRATTEVQCRSWTAKQAEKLHVTGYVKNDDVRCYRFVLATRCRLIGNLLTARLAMSLVLQKAKVKLLTICESKCQANATRDHTGHPFQCI